MRYALTILLLLSACASVAQAQPATGYATATMDNPASALTGFSLVVDLSDMPASWWSEVDTTDGTKGRVYEDDGTTELAVDWIDFDDTGETGHARINMDVASSGTQTIRIYPPVAANSSVASSATYGSDNAYDSNWVHYWEDGGETDRVGTNDGTGQNGITLGGATGQVGAGTDYDVASSHHVRVTDIDSDSDFTALAWAYCTSDADQCYIFDNGVSTNGGFQLFRFITNDSLRYRIDDSGSNGAANDTGTDTFEINTWYQVGLTVDVSGNLSTVIDGTAGGATTNISGYADTSGTQAGGLMYIGGEITSGDYFDGILDELQIHSVVRGTDWLSTEYAQTNDQNNFWNLGGGTWTWNAASSGGVIDPISSTIGGGGLDPLSRGGL